MPEPSDRHAGGSVDRDRDDRHDGKKDPEDRPDARDDEVVGAFRAAIDEGRVRLGRSWPSLLSTGFIGGFDVGVGVLALLVVEEATGSKMLGSLAFTLGFLALNLARSELFTENFLVPVATVVSRDASLRSLARLWFGTLFMNLIAGWLVAALIAAALPSLHPVMEETAAGYLENGLGMETFLLAIMAGGAITLMTWMERNAAGEVGALFAVLGIAFLLAAVPLNHIIVASIDLFGALHVGADFGYMEWARFAGFAVLGNTVGGLGLVTILRFVQVGGEEIRRQRARPRHHGAGEADATEDAALRSAKDEERDGRDEPVRAG